MVEPAPPVEEPAQFKGWVLFPNGLRVREDAVLVVEQSGEDASTISTQAGSFLVPLPTQEVMALLAKPAAKPAKPAKPNPPNPPNPPRL